jgi:selenocysteine-specific elongation factor
MAKLIGTAGHVDHGKTTLIRALTGIDADRLPEEKQRGMTIDIGFAYLDLPRVGRVSIVDVPGHERFITNMLVGALGIDVAMLCVAADESVMPQTREHLQILELLPVDKLVVALTRADLADQETREIATAEVEELIASTRFGSAQIVPVSAHKGEGIEELLGLLEEALLESDQPSRGPWYLPIDRVFAVKGHGCVVTGTLAQGEVKVGEIAYVEPGRREVRIRGIHSHEQQLEKSEKGKRTALNLGGVKVEEIHRGQAVGAPGALFETTVIDARIRWVEQARHGVRVRVSIGSEEAIGRMFLNEVEPDVVQLRLESPVACALHQPLIVRRYSPPDVLAGGRVLVPQAKIRRKSEAPTLVHESGSEEDAILEVVAAAPSGVMTDEICRVLGKTPQALGDTFESLVRGGKLKGFAGLWLTSEAFDSASERLIEALKGQHEATPQQSSVPREKVLHAAKLPWQGKPLDRILAHLAAEDRVVVSGTTIRDPNFAISLSPKQQALLERVKEGLEKEGVNVPGSLELARALAVPVQAIDEIVRLGLQAGELVRVADGIVYTLRQIEELKETVRKISGGKPFAAAQFRDAVGTTRKYAIPLLEYFDQIRFTTRTGDMRMLNER